MALTKYCIYSTSYGNTIDTDHQDEHGDLVSSRSGSDTVSSAFYSADAKQHFS